MAIIDLGHDLSRTGGAAQAIFIESCIMLAANEQAIDKVATGVFKQLAPAPDSLYSAYNRATTQSLDWLAQDSSFPMALPKQVPLSHSCTWSRVLAMAICKGLLGS